MKPACSNNALCQGLGTSGAGANLDLQCSPATSGKSHLSIYLPPMPYAAIEVASTEQLEASSSLFPCWSRAHSNHPSVDFYGNKCSKGGKILHFSRAVSANTTAILEQTSLKAYWECSFIEAHHLIVILGDWQVGDPAQIWPAKCRAETDLAHLGEKSPIPALCQFRISPLLLQPDLGITAFIVKPKWTIYPNHSPLQAMTL